MAAQLEHLVAGDLRIIGRIVPRRAAFIFVAFSLPVGFDRQMAAAAAGRPAEMTGEADHIFVFMCPIIHRDAAAKFKFARFCSAFGHEFRPCRLEIEVGMRTIDAVLDQTDPPAEFGIDNRPLDQDAVATGVIKPFKAPFAIGVAEEAQVFALWPRRQIAGHQGRIGIGGAVTVLAADFDCIGNFAVDQAVTMAILRKMTIGALHADFGMDAHHMDGFARIYTRFDKFSFAFLAEFFRIIIGDDIVGIGAVAGLIAFGIKQIAIPVAFQDRPEIPAMAVIVGKLRIFGFAVDVIDIAQEIDIRPKPLGRCAFRIAVEHLADFLGIGIFLLLVFFLIFLVAHAFRLRRFVVRTRPHIGRVGFIVPHRVAEIAVQEDIRLMHMAVHALGGRDGAGEGML